MGGSQECAVAGKVLPKVVGKLIPSITQASQPFCSKTKEVECSYSQIQQAVGKGRPRGLQEAL